MLFGKSKLIEKLKKQLSDREAELKASQGLFQDAQDKLKDLQKRSADTKAELTSVIEAKEAEIMELTRKNEALSSSAEAAEKNKNAAAVRIESLEEELSSLKTSLSSKDSEIASLKDRIAAFASAGTATDGIKSGIREAGERIKEAVGLSGKEAAAPSGEEGYDVTFVADGKVVSKARMSSEADADKIPPVPEREGCFGEWQYEDCGDGSVIVTAVYTPKAYDLVFFVDDVKYAEARVCKDDVSGIPPVPEREDYDGEWVYTVLDGNSARIDAFYTPKRYVLQFFADGEKVLEKDVDAESGFQPPAVPAKEGYDGEWQYEECGDGIVRVDAVYVPNSYDLVFFVDDEKYAEATVHRDDVSKIPPVPEKEDYDGEWVYTVLDGNSARIDAFYTPKKYRLQFFADGRKVCEADADAESGFQPPAVPAKEGYDGEWQYELCDDNVVRVDAVYAPNAYDLVFFVDDEKYAEMTVSKDDAAKIPPVPERKGCKGEWVYTVLDGNSARIDALYTPIEGTGCMHLTFYVDGEKYMERDVASEDELEDMPPVPPKDDYVGSWEYEETGDDTADIIAVYEPIEYKMTFYVDGEKYAEAVMTADDDPSVIPKVPAKPGFNGEWRYSRQDDEVIVTAVYTAN